MKRGLFLFPILGGANVSRGHRAQQAGQFGIQRKDFPLQTSEYRPGGNPTSRKSHLLQFLGSARYSWCTQARGGPLQRVGIAFQRSAVGRCKRLTNLSHQLRALIEEEPCQLFKSFLVSDSLERFSQIQDMRRRGLEMLYRRRRRRDCSQISGFHPVESSK